MLWDIIFDFLRLKLLYDIFRRDSDASVFTRILILLFYGLTIAFIIFGVIAISNM